MIEVGSGSSSDKTKRESILWGPSDKLFTISWLTDERS
jgi:hypothetical protein